MSNRNLLRRCILDGRLTDPVKIQASYEPCQGVRFKQERKQPCNTSIVLESSAQKVCLHRGAFYLRFSLAASSPCSQAKALTRRWVRKQIRYSLVRRPSETGTVTPPESGGGSLRRIYRRSGRKSRA